MQLHIPFVVALCIAIAGCSNSYNGGSRVDPTVATLGCGALGAGVGAGVAGKGNRAIGALIGGLFGAGLCNWLANARFDDVEEGAYRCETEDGVRVCLHNDPQTEDSDVLASCDPLNKITMTSDGSRAWECRRPNGEYHYYPRA